MKKIHKRIISAACTLGLLVLLTAASLTYSPIFVKGILFNKPIETTVDSELAKHMLSDPEHISVKLLFETYKNRPLNTQTLSDIHFEHSADVATFYFVQRIYQLPENKKTQDIYYSYIEQLHKYKTTPALNQLKDYYIVFIPGLGYKDFPGTGAHFKQQRKLLNKYGIPNELIKTKQWGVIEDNALIIAERLKTLCVNHDKIILVSSSKSGLETAIVLGKMLKLEETVNIKAWISVAGDPQRFTCS